MKKVFKAWVISDVIDEERQFVPYAYDCSLCQDWQKYHEPRKQVRHLLSCGKDVGNFTPKARVERVTITVETLDK